MPLALDAARVRRVSQDVAKTRHDDDTFSVNMNSSQESFATGFDYCVSLYKGIGDSGYYLLGDACRNGFHNAVADYIYSANDEPYDTVDFQTMEDYRHGAFTEVIKEFQRKKLKSSHSWNMWNKKNVCVLGNSFTRKTVEHGINLNTALAIYLYTKEELRTYSGHYKKTLSVYQSLNEFLWQPFKRPHTRMTQTACEFAAAMTVGLKELPDPAVTTTFPVQRYSASRGKAMSFVFRGESLPYFHCREAGDNVMAPGFLSASTSFDTPTSRCKGGFVFIEVDPLYTRGRDVSVLSYHEKEDEVMFPAGSNFKCRIPTISVKKFYQLYSIDFKDIPWKTINNKCGNRVTWVQENMPEASNLIKLFKKYSAAYEQKFTQSQPYGGRRRSYPLQLESAYPCRLCGSESESVCERCRR